MKRPPAETNKAQDEAGAVMQGTPLVVGLRKEMLNPKFSDFVVVVDEKEFQCHKVILAATSKFFETMFQSEMKEMSEGRVDLQGINSEIFDHILSWMYFNDKILTNENVFKVLLAANQLGMDSLLSNGKLFLTRTISVDNWAEIFKISQMLEFKQLEELSWNLLLKYFDKVTQSAIDTLKVDDMKRLLSSPSLVTESEDMVVRKVLKWVDGDDSLFLQSLSQSNGDFIDRGSQDKDLSENSGDSSDFCQQGGDKNSRIRHVTDLLQECRYLLLSNSCVFETLVSNENLSSNQSCQLIIQDIMHYKLQLDTHQHWCHPAAIHRKSSLKRNVILLVSPQTLLCGLPEFSCSIWKKTRLKFPRRNFVFTGGAYYNGSTYFEVSENYGRFHYLYVYDPDCNEVICLHGWENQHNYSTVAMLPIEDALVVIRHNGKDFKLESMNLLCRVRSSWHSTPLPALAKWEVSGATSLGSKLIILWKVTDKPNIVVGCYNPETQTYQTVETFNTTSMVSFKKSNEVYLLQEDGQLWRLTGESSLTKVSTNLWRGQQELISAMVVCDKLYVFIAGSISDVCWNEPRSLAGVFSGANAVSINMFGKVVTVFHSVFSRDSDTTFTHF